jgi:hypothetical protein
MFRPARILIAIALLVLASLACQVLTGGPDSPAPSGDAPAQEEATAPAAEPANEEPTTAPAESGPAIETEFPLPEDAMNAMDLGNGMISFQTEMTIEETLEFYREALSAEGYTEREITTATTETTLNLVFDGHASGDAIVIQAVDLGNGTVNITIRFEDV